MSETPNLDHLTKLARELVRLLEESEPGLFSWREMLQETLADIAEYAPKGPKP